MDKEKRNQDDGPYFRSFVRRMFCPSARFGLTPGGADPVHGTNALYLVGGDRSMAPDMIGQTLVDVRVALHSEDFDKARSSRRALMRRWDVLDEAFTSGNMYVGQRYINIKHHDEGLYEELRVALNVRETDVIEVAPLWAGKQHISYPAGCHGIAVSVKSEDGNGQMSFEVNPSHGLYARLYSLCLEAIETEDIRLCQSEMRSQLDWTIMFNSGLKALISEVGKDGRGVITLSRCEVKGFIKRNRTEYFRYTKESVVFSELERRKSTLVTGKIFILVE